MPNPWDNDPIVAPAAKRANPAAPWEADPVVGEEMVQTEFGMKPKSEVFDIVGGTPEKSASRSGLELGGRSVLQGIGGLVGALGGDAFNQFIVDPARKLFSSDGADFQPTPSYRDVGSRLADELGLYAPQNSRERVLGDIGEGLTGTGLTLGAGGLANTLAKGGATALAPLGELLTAQPVQQVIGTALGTGASSNVRENGGGTGAQIAAALAGGMAPGAVTAGGGAMVRGAARGRSGADMQQVIDDFAELGATPSVGQATGSRFLQGAENVLGGGPTSAGVIGRFVEKQADDIGTGLKAKADALSRNATATTAGRAIREGVDDFTGEVRQTRTRLYNQVDQHVRPDTPVALSLTQQALADLTTPTPGAAATTGAMVNSQIKALADNIAADMATAQAAGGTGIPYEAVKAIRTKLGEDAFSFTLTPDKPTAQLRQLYRALTDDMSDVATQAGPAASQAVKRANTYYAASIKRLEALEYAVDKAGGPEKVFSGVMAGTKDGATTLRAVMRSLPDVAQRKALTAAVIKRMGLATKGQQDMAGEQFSAASFLTNWNGVSKEAKQTLFNGYGPGFANDMDTIARVAENIKTGSKVMANPSGTANRAASYGYVTALIGSLFADPTMVSTTGLIGGGVAANAVARGMTNPKFVKWLARETQAPRGSAIASLNALRNIANDSKDDELLTIYGELKDASEKDDGANDE